MFGEAFVDICVETYAEFFNCDAVNIKDKFLFEVIEIFS